MCWTIQKSYS